MDAIAHILEFYFADEKALSTLAIDDALLRTIVEMTDRLHYNAQDIVARGNLAWSATLALNGLSGVGMNGGDWGCHGIEHAFSALHPEIAHGEGLGVIFPAWIVSERENPVSIPALGKMCVERRYGGFGGAPFPQQAA